MTRPFLLKFITVAVVISPALFPAIGTATCDLEKIPVSLKAINQPITEILKDIEKQAGYTIKVQNGQALTNKKTIELDQASLNVTLNRLFKDINYSTICNNEKKILTLVFLDKSANPSSVSVPKKPDVPQGNNMKGFADASQIYKNNKGQSSASKQKTTDTPQQEPEQMKGFSDASQIYKNNKEQPSTSKQKTTDAPQQESEQMKGFSDASQIYQNNKEQSSTSKQKTTDAPLQEPEQMKGFSDASQIYQNNKEQSPTSKQKTTDAPPAGTRIK